MSLSARVKWHTIISLKCNDFYIEIRSIDYLKCVLVNLEPHFFLKIIAIIILSTHKDHRLNGVCKKY